MDNDIPDDAMAVQIVEFVVIRDKETKEVLLKKRGDNPKDPINANSPAD